MVTVVLRAMSSIRNKSFKTGLESTVGVHLGTVYVTMCRGAIVLNLKEDGGTTH